MRLLLTSDWQVDSHNLDLCEIMLAELLAAADKHKPDCIVHAGDVKEAYSPVPVPVVQFSVRAVKTITAKHRLIVMKGNHDRTSQSADSTSWLDILKVAGAEVVSTPKVKVVSEVGGTTLLPFPVKTGVLAFLPFQHDKSVVPAMAKELRIQTQQALEKHELEKSVLIFHDEVQGQAGFRGNSGLSLRELRAAKYSGCFGGHVHLHQNIPDTNTWFIGSPFPQDWSEANCSKGILLVDV